MASKEQFLLSTPSRSKCPRYFTPSPRRPVTNIKDAKEKICSTDYFALEIQDRLIYLVVKYGFNVVQTAMAAIKHVPKNFPNRERYLTNIVSTSMVSHIKESEMNFVLQECQVLLNESNLPVANIDDILWKASNKYKEPYMAFLVCDVDSCLIPGCNGKTYGAIEDTVSTTLFTMRGPVLCLKATLKCRKCSARYNIDKYKLLNGPSLYYPQHVKPNVITASNKVYFSEDVFEMMCELGNHGFVSAQAFCESYNTVFGDNHSSMKHFLKWNESLSGLATNSCNSSLEKEDEPKNDDSDKGVKENNNGMQIFMSRKNATNCYFNGELEKEVRQRRLENHVQFDNENSREEIMKTIDSLRKTEIYAHPESECTEICKKKGCENLRVIDSCWKLCIPHCMLSVPTEVRGYPLLNFPDVCTSEPYGGSVFCLEHHKLLERHGVPTGKKEFLQHIGCTAYVMCENVYTDNGDNATIQFILNNIPQPASTFELKKVGQTSPIAQIIYYGGGNDSVVDINEGVVYTGNLSQKRLSFVITNVQDSAAGTYKARNTITGSEQSLTMYILKPLPKPTVIPGQMIVGQSGTLTCTAVSQTLPSPGLPITYTWTINGTTTTGYKVLTINNIRKTEKYNLYRCIATEQQGQNTSVSDVVFLDVKYPPTLRVEPVYNPYIVIFGQQDVELRCIVIDSNPAVTSIYWTDGNSVHISNIATVTFSIITPTTAGAYMCTATNGVGSPVVARITLDVQSPPQITLREKYTAIEHDTVNILCEVMANPNASVRWSRQSVQSFSRTGDRLLIPNIQRSQKGSYICTATNTLTPSIGDNQRSSTTSHTRIDVQYGPETVTFTPSTTEYAIIEPGNIPNVTCNSQCKPICEYRWTKNGQPTSHGTGNILSLRNINRSSDGLYACTTWNDHVTKESDNIDVNVLYPARITSISISGGETNVMEKQEIVLQCVVEANPLPSIQWYKGNAFSQTSEPTNSSHLTIGNANCLDTGNYSCTADNKITVNSKDVEIITITVNCSPRLQSLHQEDSEIGIDEGESLNITVQFIAYPEPYIIWIFDNNTMTLYNQTIYSAYYRTVSKFEYVGYFTKYLMTESDFGNYTVIARNNFGSTSATFIVMARRKPDHAVQQVAVCFSAAAANISWVPGFNGGAKQTFSIYFISDVGSNTKPIMTPDVRENKTITISGLSPGTVYEFKVISSNKLGKTESEITSCMTHDIEESGSLVGIIGGITGSIAAIAIIVVIIAMIFIRRKLSNTRDENVEVSSRHQEYEDLKGERNSNVYEGNTAQSITNNRNEEMSNRSHEYEDLKGERNDHVYEGNTSQGITNKKKAHSEESTQQYEGISGEYDDIQTKEPPHEYLELDTVASKINGKEGATYVNTELSE